jgi:hypothetical protein
LAIAPAAAGHLPLRHHYEALGLTLARGVRHVGVRRAGLLAHVDPPPQATRHHERPLERSGDERRPIKIGIRRPRHAGEPIR